MTYHYSTKLTLPFEEVITNLTESLKEQGFGVLTSIDVTDALRKKLNVKFRNYRIMGACDALSAYKALTLEPHIGLMLPCTIVIQEHENGQVEVSAINPMTSIDRSIMNPTVEDVAVEITERLRRAIDELQHYEVELV
jgi:uncharacterized protein (DUF302 family)